ncbi:DUF4123 domain-containing protein [Acinetobacter baumannii]|nr:DUF4123 domain-containing protein [Acinetobacter baumannii]
MEIFTQSADFMENIFAPTEEVDESFYYFLIDSSSFSGVDSFCKDFPFDGGQKINLYSDFSENLQENGALLYSFTHEECIKNIELIKNIRDQGGLNFFNSYFEIEQIKEHLDELMEIKQPNGKIALFRFQDNFAFHATVSVLNELKWRKILSFKINYWIWQNIDNTFHRLDNFPTNRSILTTLSFSEDEFKDININLKPMRLMPLLKEYDENLKDLPFYQLYEIAINLLKEAKKQQLISFEDEILFSTLYHKFGEFLLAEGPFKKALNKTQMTAMSFQKTTDEIDLEELDDWYKRYQEVQI